MNNNNRLYNITPELPAFKVWKAINFTGLNNGSWELEEYITYGQIISSSSEYNYREGNQLTVSLKDEELWNKYFDFSNSETERNPIVWERLVHVDVNKRPIPTINDGLGPNDDYNPYFFIDNFVKKVGEENEYLIILGDFKEIIENRTWCEHNVEYDPNTLPVDPNDNTKFILPDDFNKIKYPITSRVDSLVKNEVNEIIEDLYRWNLGFDDSEIITSNLVPVDRIKGDIHPQFASFANSRRPVGYGDVVMNVGSGFNYKTIIDKRSLLEVRNRILAYCLENYNFGFNVEVKIQTDGLMYVIINPERVINIDGNIDNDNVVGYNIEFNRDSGAGFILLESKNDDFIYGRVRYLDKFRFGNIKDYEQLGETDNMVFNDINEDISEIRNQEIAKKQVTELDIEFVNKRFLVDLKLGDIINLTNQREELLNGNYRIEGISEDVEGDYVNYGITELIKLS